ncbi:hypothetical protein Ataiwa_31670 [Algoriphagus taiwanensis]|uniref:Uncharacterized protein n=1 Tax=Algoriphagus taiwanensis TaxID=1445656 RepID=A0ABQ6Q3Z5_9BACT|nr:hypothetical protein Ataiwa_31670 [Algoriphagus taiwanensis]
MIGAFFLPYFLKTHFELIEFGQNGQIFYLAKVLILGNPEH